MPVRTKFTDFPRLDAVRLPAPAAASGPSAQFGVQGSGLAAPGRVLDYDSAWRAFQRIYQEIIGLQGDVSSVAAVGGVNIPTSTTSYMVQSTDSGALITPSTSSAFTITVPQASDMPSVFFFWVENRGSGAVIITPTGSTIDGAATFVLAQNQGVLVVSDGTNYYTQRGMSAGVSLIKSQSVTTGAIGASSSASVTLTWSAAFPDANYSPYASVLEATATTSTLRVHHIVSFSASNVVVLVTNDDAVNPHTGTLYVQGVHS